MMACWLRVCTAALMLQKSTDYPDNASLNCWYIFACLELLMAKVQPSVVHSALQMSVTPAIHHRATVPPPVMMRLHMTRAS